MPPRRRNPNSPRARGGQSRRRMSIPEIDTSTRSRSTAYEDLVLNQVRRTASRRTVPVAPQSAANITDDTRRALEFAREGDDSLLMPYQPTPSINPGRPRTRAMGYDSKSRTLWIRFRESKKDPNGAVYEYYNVPPNLWKNVRRVQSPGRWMNRALIDKYPYSRTDL